MSKSVQDLECSVWTWWGEQKLCMLFSGCIGRFNGCIDCQTGNRYLKGLYTSFKENLQSKELSPLFTSFVCPCNFTWTSIWRRTACPIYNGTLWGIHAKSMINNFRKQLFLSRGQRFKWYLLRYWQLRKLIIKFSDSLHFKTSQCLDLWFLKMQRDCVLVKVKSVIGKTLFDFSWKREHFGLQCQWEGHLKLLQISKILHFC